MTRADAADPNPTSPEPAGESCADWIARALYDPQSGYYTRRIRTVGRGGDFSTSATLGGALAAALAAHVLAAWKRDNQRAGLIEIGPGDGSLAKAMRRHFPPCHPLRRRHHLVEISPVLRTLQQKILGNRVQWHDTPAQALAALDGHALIIGHELVDAFPPELVRWNGNTWDRLGLTPPGPSPTHFTPLPWPTNWPRDAHTPLDPSQWPDNRIPPGQQIELLESFRSWFASWRPAWQSGSLLWIDYGDHFPALYHRRPGGTLRAFLQHQRLEGPAVFQAPGLQDITCDVNFTDLRRWGEQLGLLTTLDESQGSFLQRTLGTRHANDPSRTTGPAEAFRVLAQSIP